jgi:hypothetical protein
MIVGSRPSRDDDLRAALRRREERVYWRATRDSGRPPHSILDEAIGRLSAGLKQSMRDTGAVGHRLSVGQMREQAVIAALSRHLPGRYTLSSGLVVNAAAEQSHQQDIIISDSLFESPFLTEGQLGVHPVESVFGVVEVKSRATAASIRSAVENVASVKRLFDIAPQTWGAGTKDAEGDKMFGGILCLERGASRTALFDAYLDANLRLLPEDRTNVLVVVDEFAAVWSGFRRRNPGLGIQSSATWAERLHRVEGESALLAFYVLLRTRLRGYEPPPLDLRAYVDYRCFYESMEETVRELTPTQRRPELLWEGAEGERLAREWSEHLYEKYIRNDD